MPSSVKRQRHRVPDSEQRSRIPDSTHSSNLTMALLRIGVSFDLQTLLHEIVDSARVLTGARYGALATIDDAGHPQDFVTVGLSDKEYRAMMEWPDGPKLFTFFRDLEKPLRLTNFFDYVRSLGFAPNVMRWQTFQGTPMRHSGVHLGNFYLAEKEDGTAFTDKDEETLVLFASQAAAAIAHARAYHKELVARTHLETLIEISPIGVVVVDGTTGHPISFNRETKRIMQALNIEERPVEELLQTMTCQFSNGSTIAFDQVPFTEVIRNAQTIRSEEVVFSVSDGRSVTVLLNATPIHHEGTSLTSIVITLQDLTPLDELERMRAEFLGMVSHELRAPLTAINGAIGTLLQHASELEPEEQREFHRIIADQADSMRILISDLLDVGRINTGILSVSPMPSELRTLVEQARTTFLVGNNLHPILIDLPSTLPRVLADRKRLVQVLNNLLANAARYSPGSSPIQISAMQDGQVVAITVSDKGRGVQPERLSRLFRKYPSDGERGIMGGLGLSICKGLVEAHGGRIHAESDGIGLGTRVTFTIPVAETPGSPVALSKQAASGEAKQKARILVVDDDPQTLRYIRHTLTHAGHTVVGTGDPTALVSLIEKEQPDLILLDLVLPGNDGLQLLEHIPELNNQPVIFISGYGHDETITRVFEAGAEDYIAKPFSSPELIARVHAVLRRQSATALITVGDLTIDDHRRRVSMAGRPIELTALQYELLRVLSLNAGCVVTYNTLLRRVWHGRAYGDYKTLIRTFVKKLRQKLGDDLDTPAYIVTERGVGYRLARPGDAEQPSQPDSDNG